MWCTCMNIQSEASLQNRLKVNLEEATHVSSKPEVLTIGKSVLYWHCELALESVQSLIFKKKERYFKSQK